MNLLVYGVFPALTDVPQAVSLSGLKCMGTTQLKALVREAEHLPDSTDTARVVAYGETIDNLRSSLNLLPMRYGSLLADFGALQDFLLQHEEALISRLRDIEGCVELSIRLAIQSKEETHVSHCANETSHSGLEYLNRLKRKYDNESSAGYEIDEIKKYLKGHYRESLREISVLSGHRYLCEHFLVPLNQVGAFHEIFRAHNEKDALTLTGPWTPWNFADWNQHSDIHHVYQNTNGGES